MIGNQDNITFPGNLPALATIPALRGVMAATLSADANVIVQGGDVSGDGGGGTFVWKPSSTDNDDGILVIRPNDVTGLQAGRWKAIGSAGAGVAQLTTELQGSAGSNVVGYKSGYANTVARTVQARLRDLAVSVKDFGALGNGTNDDRPAIQAAIDTVAAAGGGTVVIPVGVYTMSYTAAADGGVVCLLMRDNVALEGEDLYGSVLKLKTNSGYGFGTYIRIIASAAPVTNVSLYNFTLDGNRSGQGVFAAQGNGGNIVFHARSCIIDGIRSIEGNGQGIQIRGAASSLVERLVIRNCIVDGMSGSTLNSDGSVQAEFNGNGIGIQVSQALEYIITGNRIRNCKDNAIDTYNENPGMSASGGIALITGNTMIDCRCGIFPETTARTIVSTNYIYRMVEAGIAINRINSSPDFVAILDNTIEQTLNGIRVSGNTDSLKISGNWIGFIYNNTGSGIRLDNTSQVLVENNTFKIEFPTVPLVAFTGAQGVFSLVTGNKYWNNPTDGYLCFRGATDMFGTVVDDFMPVNAVSGRNTTEGQMYRKYARFDNFDGGVVKTATVGFNGSAPRGKFTLPAAATDPATTMALANALRDMAISFGLGV